MNREARQTAIFGGAALVACAACCAPLVLPVLAGIVAAGGLAWTVAGSAGLLTLTAAAAGVAYYRRRSAQGGVIPLDRGQGCGCGADDPDVDAAGDIPAARASFESPPSSAAAHGAGRPSSFIFGGGCGPSCGATVPDITTKGE